MGQLDAGPKSSVWSGKCSRACVRLPFAVLCVAVGVLASCGDAPTSPSPPLTSPSPPSTFTGVWTGTMTSDYVKDGEQVPRVIEVSALLNQSGEAISGTFEILPPDPGRRPQPVTGTTDGDTAVLVFSTDVCTQTATGTRSGNFLSISDFRFAGRSGECFPGYQLFLSLTRR